MKIVTGSCFHAASASKVTTFYGQGYITSLQEVKKATGAKSRLLIVDVFNDSGAGGRPSSSFV